MNETNGKNGAKSAKNSANSNLDEGGANFCAKSVGENGANICKIVKNGASNEAAANNAPTALAAPATNSATAASTAATAPAAPAHPPIKTFSIHAQSTPENPTAPLENPAFLREQIITYIGNKRALLGFLAQGFDFARRELKRERISVLDAFSGSGVVARFAKGFASRIVANDLEDYARVINACYLANACADGGADLDGAGFGRDCAKFEFGDCGEENAAENFANELPRAVNYTCDGSAGENGGENCNKFEFDDPAKRNLIQNPAQTSAPLAQQVSAPNPTQNPAAANLAPHNPAAQNPAQTPAPHPPQSIDPALLRELFLRLTLRPDELRAGFLTQLYAPQNDQQIQPGERAFFTRENAIFLDSMRAKIAREIPRELQHFFIAPLIYEASVHANTSGVFKGFYKDKNGVGSFGGRGGHALKRICGKIALRLPVFSRFSCPFEVRQMDALALARELDAIDVAYLDPPYNQHPYGSNYFMLNLVANYSAPREVSAVSGIPRGWQRSEFNRAARAEDALFELIATLRARVVLLSYNCEGFVKRESFEHRLAKLGRVFVLERRYNAFRGSRNLASRPLHIREQLYVLVKG